MDPEAAFLLACNDLHNGQASPGSLAHIIPHLGAIPEIVLRRDVLPPLQRAASNSRVGREQWFFRKDERPQLLEVLEAPLTSVYAGRIACWTFLEGTDLPPVPGSMLADLANIDTSLLRMLGGRRPVLFAVTGHGPGPVCSRVSAIVNDLANERNCPSDLLLAGTSFFDLEAEPSPSSPRTPWNLAELEKRIGQLAAQLGIGDALPMQEFRPFLTAFAGRMVRPTIEATRESLAQAERDMGFIANKDIDVQHHREATQALDAGASPSVGESFPVLAGYRHKGERLTVSLPLCCLGLEDYDRVVVEYRRAVCEDLRREWERRRVKYEEWSRQFARSLASLRVKLQREGQHALSSGIIYISVRIDPETATEIPIDPPEPLTELEYLSRLPLMTAHQLAYWAWADHKMKSLPEEEAFRPHWEQTCLVDAFLRNWPIPTEDEKLNAAREQWQEKWRPLALAALDVGLKERGLSLPDIAVENTVFRVVGQDDRTMTLELLHVWDPCHDALPPPGEAVTLFAPAFGNRQRETKPAKAAQKHAVKMLDRALAETPLPPDGLRQALSADSGAAVDRLVEWLCRPFVHSDLERDIQRVRKDLKVRTDPLLAFGLQERLDGCSTLHDYLKLATDCGKAGQRETAPPDFLAWELYLIGVTVRNLVDNILQQAQQSGTGVGRLRLPGGIQVRSVAELQHQSPWQMVEGLVRPGEHSSMIEAVLTRFLDAPQAVGRAEQTFATLEQRDGNYAQRCLSTDGPPPLSTQRETQYAPHCLSGWQRTCYDLAEGDAALSLAWTAREGGRAADWADLAKLATAVETLSIETSFERVAARRTGLLKDLRKFLSQRDRVSLQLATASVRQAVTDAVGAAEMAYQRAAALDVQQGSGWLRLAKLKWLTAHYREALSILVGPAPQADLQACQLPFAVAVRVAGGELTVTPSDSEAWSGPDATEIMASRSPEGDLVLDATSAISPIARCVVSGLRDDDVELLCEFFEKYRPDMLQSAGTDTFENWLCLARVPNLGQRAIAAEAIQGETEFAALAAAVYLGAPDVLSQSPGSAAEPRPRKWLDEDVVTACHWRQS